MTKLPIGISDYKHLIESGYYYVDKTLLIKEIIEVGGAVALICRPRRFGKTLNLSMLHYFFEKTEESNVHLFTDKDIWQDKKYNVLQGQYPVIFLTFKDVKEKTWEIAYEKLVFIIAKEYKRHQSLIEQHAQSINSNDLELYYIIAAQKGRFVDVSQSLQFLSMLLQKITKTRVIVLLDEYDTPIHAAYSYSYYDEMVDFLRGFFSAGLKDNACLERAVLTGILRTAKEGIFSGVNNLNVCTMLHNSFADKFGFVSHEVDTLLADQGVIVASEVIKNWYNGYHAGDSTLLYNPWSIIECVKNNAELKTYWVNTSDNSVIKKFIACSSEEVKRELEMLLTHESLVKDMNEGVSFSDVQSDPDALWSMLLFSGYVTYSQRTLTKKGKYSCSLVIPNNEIQTLYEDFLLSIFKQSLTTTTINVMLTALQTGDVVRFSKILQEFIANSMSYYDFSPDEPEKSYHLFILGLLVFLSDIYQVRSNRESGSGRYDLMLIPKDKTKCGILIECKKANSDEQQILEELAKDALKQVREKNYIQELHAQSVSHILVYAIVFYGKKLLIKLERM